MHQIVYDHDSRRSKGYGFVSFEDARDAEIALERANGKVSSLDYLHLDRTVFLNATGPLCCPLALSVLC